MRWALERRTDGFKQLVVRERFSQEPTAPGFEGQAIEIRIVAGSDEDDGNIGVHGVKAGLHVEAGEPRHVHVEDHAVRALRLERGKKKLFQPDWRTVFEPENVMAEIKAIVNGPVIERIGLNSGTNATRNRLTFQQTAAATNYDRLIADFDFRAQTTAAASLSLPATVQDFDASGTAYTLVGSTTPAILPADAGSTGRFLRLVPASEGQLGRIAFDRSATGAVATVVATFDFRITPPSGGTPADGFGFALLSTAAYGTKGSGPGISETPDLTSSIAIGFDDYNNGTTPAEPNNNHLSLHWNGAQVGNAFTPTFSMSNGKFHRAQIIISFSGNNAYVTARLTPDINGTPGATETVLQNVRIAGVAPYESRVAFGARTGGAWASHDIDNVNVQFISNNVTLASGLSLLFLPTSQFGATGAGSTLSTFTDLPLVSNALALDFAFNPSNLVNDVSLYWNAGLASSMTLPSGIADLDGGRFFHVRLELDAGANGAYATLSLTPDSLGIPGQPINVFSNYFIAGARLAGSRLEFAARNGGLTSRLELDNVLATFEVLEPMLLNPGESIVVVRNKAAFISRYGSGIHIAGEYSGLLNNAGDHLVLLGPVGEPILDFHYDAQWYPITDGVGFSLVAVDPTAPAANWGLASNWRISSAPLGSPGVIDPSSQIVPRVLVNEALAHPVPPELDWDLWIGPAPKRPSKPRLSCSSWISFCCFFQSTPKGGLVRK
jgi:hypothetical protein